MEWLAGEKEPSKFSVATLPDSTSLKHIVYRIKEYPLHRKASRKAGNGTADLGAWQKQRIGPIA
jgi:hypothetical protein